MPLGRILFYLLLHGTRICLNSYMMYLLLFKWKGRRVLSELDFAAEILPRSIKMLAVTGTNGKSTVSTFTGQVPSLISYFNSSTLCHVFHF